MSKPICSLLVLNLKDITRIVGNSILPPKRSSVVQFRNIDQIKAALKLQEDGRIDFKEQIPSEILKEIYPIFIQEESSVEVTPEPVVEEVEPVIEDTKPKRKKRGSSE